MELIEAFIGTCLILNQNTAKAIKLTLMSSPNPDSNCFMAIVNDLPLVRLCGAMSPWIMVPKSSKRAFKMDRLFFKKRTTSY